MKKATLIIVALLLLLPLNTEAQSRKKKKAMEIAAKEKASKEQTEKKKEGKIKEYSKIITKNAISDEGLFISHKVEDKYFFEIPKVLLGKEM